MVSRVRTAPLACLDLDGTLVDSRGPFAAAMRGALREQGLPDREPAALHRFLGPPLEETTAAIVADAVAAGLVPAADAPAAAEALLGGYRRRYVAEGIPATVAVPGVPAALDRLRDAGWRFALVTSKIRPAAVGVLEATGLGAWIDAVHAPSPDERHVPKARSLRAALAEHGGDAALAAVMVGERHHDVDAARACAIPAVGVTWAGGSDAELTAAGARAVVATPMALPETLAVALAR